MYVSVQPVTIEPMHFVRPLTCGRRINWIIIKKLRPNISSGSYAIRVDEKASIAFPISPRAAPGTWAPGILRMETFPSISSTQTCTNTRSKSYMYDIYTLARSRQKNREGEKEKSVCTSNLYHNVNCLRRFSKRECTKKLFWISTFKFSHQYSWETYVPFSLCTHAWQTFGNLGIYN